MTKHSIWAVIPVKPFALAKSRLAPVLSDRERSELARLMLEQVLDVVGVCKSLCGTIVVTRDPVAHAIAQECGATVLADSKTDDINGAVGIAVHHLLQHHGHDAGMIVIPLDLPRLTPDTICNVATRLADHAVVVIPAANDGGTNMLGLSPPDSIAPSFGTDSFKRHIHLARVAELSLVVIQSDDAAYDVDRPEDLQTLLSRPCPAPIQMFLTSSDIAARIRASAQRGTNPRVPQEA